MLGSGFAPGHVTLRAYQFMGFLGETALPVNPDVVAANAYGKFFTSLTICGYGGFGKPSSKWISSKGILVGTDSNGVQSNPALF